jgi:hypothetical protein
MPAPIDRSELRRLLAAGAQLAEVLRKEEYDEEHLPWFAELRRMGHRARWRGALATGCEIL